MERFNTSPDWIGAYLQWNEQDFQGRAAHAEEIREGAEFCEAYLEWLGSSSEWRRRETGSQPHGRRASDAVVGAYGSREAVLLTALNAQSDCLHILRQLVSNGGAKAGVLRLAAEVLEHSQRMIEDERLAWQALDDLHGFGQKRSGDAWHQRIDAAWPSAIEHVVADVRTLSNTVLAMQFH